MVKPKSWWGVPILVVMAVVLGAGLWLLPGIATRTGASWEDEVLRRGTATITDCRRAPSAAFLTYTCGGEVVWADPDADTEADERPSPTYREASAPYRVWSLRPIAGQQDVVTHRRPAATRRGNDHEVLTTADYPAGSGRGWLGAGYLLMIVLPLAAGVITHRILVGIGIAPRGGTRSSRKDHGAVSR